nr:SWIM zinc finger family protein [Scopulibacillus daqui]
MIKDPQLKYWLEIFNDSVEAGRLRRGKALFREGAVIELDFNPDDGFSAEVVGSHGSVYQVVSEWSSGHYFESLLLPFPEDIYFHCTCPDNNDRCKHIVAAVIRWITEYDRDIESKWAKPKVSASQSLSKQEPQTLNKRRTSQRVTEDYSLESLQYLANKKASVAARTGYAPFWHIKPNLNHLLMFVYNDMRQFSKNNRLK